MGEGRRVGPYVLERRLGGGGMGEVWLARHAATGARHALKLMTLGDPDAALRAAREAEALARLDGHPNAVRVHGAFVEGARMALALELVEGEDLEARLSREGPLHPEEAARLVRDLAGAVTHAHGRGVLHRDLKPANVLLDGAGAPRLIDLGLARLIDSTTLTRSGDVLGTLAYLAPEQARGERCDERTDVFGLGALLFAALVGQPPRRTGWGLEALARAAADPVPRADVVRPDVPRDLADLVARATAFDPGARHPSADALARDLEAWLAGPRAPTRRARRGIVLALVGASVAVSLAASLAVRREKVEAARAAAARAAAAAAGAYEADVVRPWWLGLGAAAPEAPALLAHAAAASDAGRVLADDEGERAAALAGRLAALAPLVSARAPAGIPADAPLQALVEAIQDAEREGDPGGVGPASVAAATSKGSAPDDLSRAARARVSLATLRRATEPARARAAAAALAGDLPALFALDPARPGGALTADALVQAAGASIGRALSARSLVAAREAEAALGQDLDALAAALGAEAVAAVTSARRAAVAETAEPTAERLVLLASEPGRDDVFELARTLALAGAPPPELVRAVERRAPRPTDQAGMQVRVLERAVAFDVAWRLVLGGPRLDAFDGWFVEAIRHGDRARLSRRGAALARLCDAHRSGYTSRDEAPDLPATLLRGKDPSRLLTLVWLGIADLAKAFEADPERVLRALAVGFGLAPDARDDIAVDAVESARHHSESDLVAHVVGQTQGALQALVGAGSPRAAAVAPAVRSLTHALLARGANADPCTEERVVSAACSLLKSLGDDTSDLRAALVERILREPTSASPERRHELVKAQRLAQVAELAAAGRLDDVLALADALWIDDGAASGEERVHVAVQVADALGGFGRRDAAVLARAREWLSRAEAIAAEGHAEGARGWLDQITKERYGRVARELAR